MDKSQWSLPDRPSPQVTWLHRRPSAGRADQALRLYLLALSALLLLSLVTVPNLAAFPWVYLLLAANGLLAVYGQVLALRAGSTLHLTSFLFSYLFMSLIPILQFGEDLEPVFHVSRVPVLVCLSALIFTACGIASLATGRRTAKAELQPAAPESRWEFHNYLFLMIPVVIATLLSFALFGRALFTSREGFGYALGAVFGDPATAGAVSNFLLQVPFFGAIIGLRAAVAAHERRWIWVFAVLTLCAVLINNPMDTARFKLAGLAFFFIEYFFRGKRLKLFILALVLGFALAPAFHVFRSENSSIKDTAYGSRYLWTDFDAFQMACYTFVAVDRMGVTWGSNIAGALLFFVPRSVWIDKPEPSSFEIFYTAQEYRRLGTNNLSNPLFSEGYYAFSWAGVLAISALYWLALTAVHRRSLKDSNSLAFLTRSVLVGLILIVLRGPLITSFTNIVANWSAAAIPWLALRALPPRRPRARPEHE